MTVTQYADKILDSLGSEFTFVPRFYRTDCNLFKNVTIKDLKLTGRPLKDVILIDVGSLI